MAKTKRKTKKKKAGRPKGVKNGSVPVNNVPASSCPVCGSTEREDYAATTTQPYSGITPEGQPYTEIIRRRTRCLSCGQTRIDRTYANRRKKKSPPE